MRFHRMTATDDCYWEPCWEIYQSNFPSGERRLLPDQKRALEDDRYYCMAILQGDRVTGILFYWMLPPFLFAEYLAISDDFKGQGIGSKTLSLLKRQPGRLILEIEPPTDVTTIRRMRFYKREGMVLNPYEHINLPLRIGEKDLPLRVMTVDSILNRTEYEMFFTMLMTDLIQYGEGYHRK